MVAAREAAAKRVRGNSGPSRKNEHRGNLPVTYLGADRTACGEEPESYPAHGTTCPKIRRRHEVRSREIPSVKGAVGNLRVRYSARDLNFLQSQLSRIFLTKAGRDVTSLKRPICDSAGQRAPANRVGGNLAYADAVPMRSGQWRVEGGQWLALIFHGLIKARSASEERVGTYPRWRVGL